jgi:hypothetical protein
MKIPDHSDEQVNAALRRLEEHANSVSGIKSVTLMDNCSIDVDRTLQLRAKHPDAPSVLTGLVVCVNGNYKLGIEDAAWLYPDIGRGRSVFEATNVSDEAVRDIELGKFHDAATINQTVEFDEMGNEMRSKNLVIDSAVGGIHAWSYIEQKATMSNLMEAWMDNEGVQGLDARIEMAKEAGAGEATYEDVTCGMYSDGQHIYVANHAVKMDDMEEVLVRHSALGGYRFVDTRDMNGPFVSCDMGYAADTYSFEELNEKTRARIDNNFIWSNGDSFNTLILRPPQVKKGPGRNALRTVFGVFSANKVSHMMSAPEILRVAPPNATVSIPVDMAHPLFNKIVHAHKRLDNIGFNVFNLNARDNVDVNMDVLREIS